MPRLRAFATNCEELAPERPELCRRGLFQRLPRIEPALVEQLERALDLIALGSGEAGAPHPEHIQPEDKVPLGREEEGRDVLAKCGAALRHHEPPDFHVLVEGRRRRR